MLSQQDPPAQRLAVARVGAALGMIVALALAGCGDTSEQTAPEETSTEADAAATPTEVEEVAEEPTEEPEEDEAEVGTRENPLPLGERATLGDYEVAVTAVNLDATDVVMDANEFNEAPAEGNTFVLVTLAGTFLGEENPEGNPGFDLSAVIVGSDARQYADFDSLAVPPNPLYDSPTLEAGGQFEGNALIEMPTEALDGAALFVEATLSFDNTATYWALG